MEGIGALLLEAASPTASTVNQHTSHLPAASPRRPVGSASGGVVLQFQVDKFIEFGELDDRASGCGSPGVRPIITPLRITFSRAESSG